MVLLMLTIGNLNVYLQDILEMSFKLVRCKITALKSFLYTDAGIFSVYLRGRLWAPVPMQNTLIFFLIW